MKQIRCCLRLVLAMAFTLWRPAPAQAQSQPSTRISDGIRLPSQSIAADDTASAILLNPANLAFAPGAELRFSIIQTGDSAAIPANGYALEAALPFWILASGLRADFMVPSNGSPMPFSGANGSRRYNWIRWANAIRLGKAASIGATLAWSRSQEPSLHNLFSLSTGLTFRPASWLSAAAVVRDINSPNNGKNTSIKPSVDMATALRPLGGSRHLEIGLESSYRSDVDRWIFGANASTQIPYVGRLRGGVQLLDGFNSPQVYANAGIEVNFGNLQVGGGAVFGNAISSKGAGFYTTGSLRSFGEDPSLPSPKTVVRIRYEKTPGVRRHIRILQRLWKMARDSSVSGLVLELRAKPVPSLAHAEELVDALRLLKAAGKKVLCHLEDASARELFVCSEANRIAINPAGGVRFAGLSWRRFYLGGLLKKLGIRADFVRIGSFKSAPEQFLTGSTSPARESYKRLLGKIENIYLRQIGRGRRMSPKVAKARIAQGPFIASEAQRVGLVDQLVYEDEIPAFVRENIPGNYRIVRFRRGEKAAKQWRSNGKVAVVYLHGNMVDGRSQNIPLLGMKLAGSYTIAKALRRARQDNRIRAVVLRIETGGGSSLASDVILREAQLTAKRKPLIVSMGSRAASGGYYAAVAGQEIFANQATLTGSIGIFYGKVDISGLLGKIGIRSEAVRSAPRADAESIYRPFSEEEHRELGKKVKQFYDLFVARVAVGRQKTPARIHALGQGQVYLGAAAKGHGLVDRLGGFRQALRRAQALAGLSHDAPVVAYPVEKQSLLALALKLSGVAQSNSTVAASLLPAALLSTARALYPLTLHNAYRAQAQTEIVFTEP